MIPVMELPGVLGIDIILRREMPKDEQDRRIRYARHELFLKMGDDIPDDLEVVIKATTTLTKETEDRLGNLLRQGDLSVRLRVHVRKLEQD